MDARATAPPCPSLWRRVKDAELRLARRISRIASGQAPFRGSPRTPKTGALEDGVESPQGRSHLDEKDLTAYDRGRDRPPRRGAAAKAASAQTYEVKGQYAARHQVELESACGARAARTGRPSNRVRHSEALRFLAERKAASASSACSATAPKPATQPSDKSCARSAKKKPALSARSAAVSGLH